MRKAERSVSRATASIPFIFVNREAHGKTRNVELTEGNKKRIQGPLATWNE